MEVPKSVKPNPIGIGELVAIRRIHSYRAGRWYASRYLRQFPSPCSPSTSLFSQAPQLLAFAPHAGQLLRLNAGADFLQR